MATCTRRMWRRRAALLAVMAAVASAAGCSSGPTPGPPDALGPRDVAERFDTDARRRAVEGLKQRYGPRYADADRHLESLAEIDRLLKEGEKAAAEQPAKAAKLADEAVRLVREFNAQSPPWLHGDLEPQAERLVVCRTADEINKAVADARAGDHVVVKPGWYEGVRLRPSGGEPFPVDNPVVVRAEAAGTVHLRASEVHVGDGAGGLWIRGFVLHGMGFGCGEGARDVRFSEMTVLGAGVALGDWNGRLDHCFIGGLQGAEPMIRVRSSRLAPCRIDHNWLGYRAPSDDAETLDVDGAEPVLEGNRVEQGFGIRHPRAPLKEGAEAIDPPSARWFPGVGHPYLPVSVRLNRYLVAEYTFGPNLATGRFSPVTESGFGLRVLPLVMHDAAGAEANLHSKPGGGAAGTAGDCAFNNTAASAMGGVGGVARGGRPAGEDQGPLHAFTIQGWFRTVAGRPVGDGAVLFSGRRGPAGLELSAPSGGTLALWRGGGQGVSETSSPQVYTESGQWVFFAVSFARAPDPATGPAGAGRVAFYKGSAVQPVRQVYDASDAAWPPVSLAGIGGFSVGARPDGSKAFDGRIDNVRLFHAADPTQPANWPGGVVAIEELELLRRNDLGLPLIGTGRAPD